MEKEKRERLATSTDASQASIDRISILPNEVLGFICSFLTMKEAIRTSILSRSWRHTWILTHKMDFRGKLPSSSSSSSRDNDDVPSKARFNFVRYVDRVLYQCLDQRHDLDSFGVSFDLNESHSVWLDDWLRYALGRKVKALKLTLMRPTNNYNTCYKFPYKKEYFPDSLKLLRKLSLHLVSVTGEAIQFFLGNCPVLEKVSLSRSDAVSSLEIIGTFPSFKCLEISTCPSLKSVEIRDSSVVTIKYCGKRIPFVLMNVPKLTQLWTKVSTHDCCLKDVYEMFSSVLQQVEMFKIYFTYPLSWQYSEDFIKSNLEMRNLKQLVVSIGKTYGDKDSLISIVNLINASPCLQRFIIEAEHKQSKYDTGIRHVAKLEDIRYKQNPRTYYHFKEMKFLGYRGVSTQLELIEHFAEKCVALENIVVDPRSFNLCCHRPWDKISRHKIKDEIVARDAAEKQFKELAFWNPRTNVKIL